MVPDSNKLKFPFNVIKLLKLPSVDGMEPEKELLLITNDVSESRLPTEGDIVPWTPRPSRSIPLTRKPPVQETPVHEQIEEEGALPEQDQPDTPLKELTFADAAKSHIAASSVDIAG